MYVYIHIYSHNIHITFIFMNIILLEKTIINTIFSTKKSEKA